MYITANSVDMSEEFNQTTDCKLISKKNFSICFGCGNQINDQYILRVSPDLEWHAKCLKCFECGIYLDENCTCFVRNGRTYCKIDYIRLFSKKCFKCKNGFDKNDLVMRANNRIYHLDCFRCCICTKLLSPGDEFALKEDGILCKFDNDYFDKQQHSLNSNNSHSINNTSCQNITNLQNNPNLNNSNNNNPKSLIKSEEFSSNPNNNDYEDNQNCLSPNFAPQQLIQQNTHLQPGQTNQQAQLIQSHLGQQQIPIHQNSNLRLLNGQSTNSNNLSTSSTSSNSSTSSGSSSSSNGNTNNTNTNIHHSHRKDKTTRVRTVLNEKQLHTLRTCYGANPRPDALMKEQLVEMTGLSPRVIRVWFQNKRCKDKKKTILIKQMQEQQKNRQTIGHGIPMVATSPVRNDINNLGPGAQVEIQQSATAYQSSTMGWNLGFNGDLNSIGHQMQGYDQMMGYGSDEEDCFDQLSDQGGDDSVSSVGGLDDTRIQQL